MGTFIIPAAIKLQYASEAPGSGYTFLPHFLKALKNFSSHFIVVITKPVDEFVKIAFRSDTGAGKKPSGKSLQNFTWTKIL
ncbi:hypothetical protein L0337_32875 [candidate division KSB1 bacterium]|nr:hypothetical protein [candidate division KSB1 bacterium]